VIEEHGYIRRLLRPIDAPAFVEQLEGTLRAYPAEHVAAQMNLLGSHDTPRLLSTCGGDEASVRMAMLLLLSLPGAPTIYYGDEIGMPGRVDPDCRRAFPWDDAQWNRPLHDWVRDAIHLRRSLPALRADGYQRLAAAGQACAFLRGDDAREHAVVAINAADQPAELPLPAMGGRLLLALATGDGEPPMAPAGDGLRATLPPRWAGIWRVVP